MISVAGKNPRFAKKKKNTNLVTKENCLLRIKSKTAHCDLTEKTYTCKRVTYM